MSRFDPDGKAKLETFLKSCIRNRVQSALRKVGRFSLRHAQPCSCINNSAEPQMAQGFEVLSVRHGCFSKDHVS